MPGVVVYLIRAVINLGEGGEIIYGLRRQPEAPSICWRPISPSGSSAIQLLAAREERWFPQIIIINYEFQSCPMQNSCVNCKLARFYVSTVALWPFDGRSLPNRWQNFTGRVRMLNTERYSLFSNYRSICFVVEMKTNGYINSYARRLSLSTKHCR